MPKRIKLELSVESIDRAIKEIEKRRAEIPKLVEKLIDKMLVVGEDYAINTVGHVDTGETLSSIMGYREGNRGVIVAGGAAVWLEFGTGVTKNMQQEHPKAQELGMRPWGTYGKGQGGDPDGWWYPGDDGRYHHTYGIQANMFMYRTAKYLQDMFETLGKEVFR